MKSILALLCLLLVVSTVVTMKADVITFKNGSEIKGEILSETPDGVLIEYYVTPTIKDQKFYSRAEIAHMVLISPAEKAFQSIGNLSTPDTVLDTAFYDLLIDKKIPEYLKSYRYSKHLSELREVLRSLDEERSRVRRGDRRIGGVWITASQIAADPYQSRAKIKFTEMKELAEANDCVGALRSYELLEKEFPGSGVMPAAIALALGKIDQLQDKLSIAKTNFEIIDKRRQQAIELSPVDVAKEIKDALLNEKLGATNALVNATADGSKFFPIFQNSKESMDSLQTLIIAEKARLTALQKIPMTEGMAAANQCSNLLSEGKLKEAQDKLAQSLILWPLNIENVRLKLRLDDLIKSQAATAAAAAQDASAPKKPTSSSTPTSTAKP